MKKKPRKASSKSLKAKAAAHEAVITDRLSGRVGEFPSKRELVEYLSVAMPAEIGEDWAEALARFEAEVVPKFVTPIVGDVVSLHPSIDASARECLGNMFLFFAALGFEAAAKLAHEKQLAATVTAVTKSKRKAAERHRQIVETFRSMTGGTKTERVRRTADELEVSASAVWDALRDAD
jgi:hypothetical protein